MQKLQNFCFQIYNMIANIVYLAKRVYIFKSSCICLYNKGILTKKKENLGISKFLNLGGEKNIKINKLYIYKL